MTDLAIAAIAAGTILVLGSWAHNAFLDFLEKTSPHPIQLESFEKLVARVEEIDGRSIRTETKLNAQGFRNG